MLSTVDKTSSKVIEWSFYLLLFFVPLIFYPESYELFEFNKIIFTYTLTTAITSAWIIKMIIRRNFVFRRTFWDLPLLVFLFSQLFSLLFSIDPHTSTFGYYSRFNGGLLSLLCYCLLYWSFVSNLDKTKAVRALNVSLASALIVSLWAISEHFGASPSCLITTGRFDVNCWVQDVQNRVFATLGQPNWLATYLIALIPLTWLQKPSLSLRFIIHNSLSIILSLALLFTKSRSGLLGLAAALVVFVGLLYLQKSFKTNLKTIVCTLVILLLASFAVGTPFTDKLAARPAPAGETQLISTQGGTESGDIRKIVWNGALQIWKNHPLLGTGPETFAYSYYWYRPREHNDVSEWDFLYNKAHNEYLNYAATTGTLGLLAYFFLIGSFFFYTIKKPVTNTLHPALLSGFSAILIANFFGFSVVVTNLLLFLLPAFAVSLEQEIAPSQKLPRQPNLAQSAALVVVILTVLFLSRSLVNYWRADFIFASARKLEKSGQPQDAFTLYREAIDLRPSEPLFREDYSVLASTLAVSARQQEMEDSAAQLTQLAISQSDQTVNANPYNLNFWKSRTKVFYNLTDTDLKWLEQTRDSLVKAASLAPTDAKIHYNLALVFAQTDQIDQSISLLEKTIRLKPNYTEAHYALAVFYEKQGEDKAAKAELQFILDKIDPSYSPALEKLKSL